MEKIYEVADVVSGILRFYGLTYGESVAAIAIVQTELIVGGSLLERAADAEKAHD